MTAAYETCLHRLFEAQAARTPDAMALLFSEYTLTYSHLNRQANRLAHHLRALGVGPDTPVAICAASGREMIVGVLGILKAGGAYLPLDPAYPAERLDFMLQDAAPRALLTQRHFLAALPDCAALPVFCLDTDATLWAGCSSENPQGGAAPDSLAYLIYTSGSTGTPKGVQIEHRSACNNLLWRQEAFPLTGDDRMLQTYSFSFDPSVWAIFWPLIAGAALALPKPGGIADSAYLVRTLAEQQITVAGFGPAMLQVLMDHPQIARCRSLRHVFCGGEPLPPALRDRFFTQLDSALHNVYGPTEATIDATCWTCPRGDTGQTIPIGFPIANTEAFVLDEALCQVPDGEEGELYLGGAGLARGYFRRPDLTAERFVRHPLSSDADARLYRTGDLARRGENGALEYRGRCDHQVKLRGFRIELGEVEAALCAHPAVQDALLVVREDAPGEKRLAAYLVVAAGTTASPADLRQFLSVRLPAYMVPAAFVFLHALPLTPSGKRDRKSLPAPGPADSGQEAEFTAAREPLQQQIVHIWESLLDTRPIGIHDNFWEIGGHSLLAARLLDQIATVTGKSLPLSALYEHATVEGLTEALRRQEPEARRSPLAKIQPGGSRPPLFFLYGFHPLGGFYCVHLARILGPDQPFYALHPHGMEQKGIASSVEAMAADYVRAVQEVQPEGPYRLGGFCGSGLVAYEMARQLENCGETVEFLGLIEVHPINARVRLLLRRLSRLPGSRNSRLFPALQRAVLPLVAAWQSTKQRVDDSDEQAVALCDRAAAVYVPRPYSGSVTLLNAQDDPDTFAGDPIDLWRETVHTVTVQDIPGTHLTCIIEHVEALGMALKTHLEAANETGRE